MAAASGTALALFAVALENVLAALLWPRAAHDVLTLCALAGGLAAFALAAAPNAWTGRVLRRSAALLALAGMAGAAAVASLPSILASGWPPGVVSSLVSFPAAFLVLATVPFVLVSLVLVAWLEGGEQRRGGWFLLGAGVGCLVAAVVAGSGLSARSPWFGGRLLEFTPAGGTAWNLSIDRGLHRDVVAPDSAAHLAFLPAPGADGRIEALLVGFPNGRVLSALLAQPNAHLSVLEEDRALVAEVTRRWPALDAARAAGRVRFIFGNPRWSLERLQDRFGLIALSQGGSPAAYQSRALAFRDDHRWTVEAFRSYLAHLDPAGYLLVERTGTGRVVATLREAAGVPAEEFFHRLVVLGAREGLSSQCWYRPDGLSDWTNLRAARAYARRTGIRLLFRPSKYPVGSFYDRLAKDEKVKGLYFSTPLDLSPPLDERPFFDNVDRLTISPVGRSMPEEPGPHGIPAQLSLIPPADRGTWALLLAGLGVAVAILAAARRSARRAGRDRGAALAAVGPSLALGVCAALSFEAFQAWARWLTPSAPASQAAVAAALCGAGFGWLRSSRRDESLRRLLILAAVLGIAAFAGYRAAPAIPLLGHPGSALAVAAAGALVGTLIGRSLRAAVLDLDFLLPGTRAAVAGALLCVVPLVYAAGVLGTTHFGYRLTWALGAVAALAAFRGIGNLRRRRTGRLPS